MLTLQTRANQKIKKGDLVRIVAGQEKGKTAKVLKVLSTHDKAILERVNLVKRHQKPNAQNQTGGIVEKESPVHLSNLAVVEAAASSPSKSKPKAAKKKSKEA